MFCLVEKLILLSLSDNLRYDGSIPPPTLVECCPPTIACASYVRIVLLYSAVYSQVLGVLICVLRIFPGVHHVRHTGLAKEGHTGEEEADSCRGRRQRTPIICAFF